MQLEYTLSEARNKFSEMISHVDNGEDIMVTKNGRGFAKISPMNCKSCSLTGWGEGKIKMSDDFDQWDEEDARALGITPSS